MEAVIVIAVTGIVAAMVAMFIRLPVQGYIDNAARAELLDVADTSLRRMARDIRLALPNSVRVTTNGGRTFLELLLTRTGGRYLSTDDNVTGLPALSFDDTTQTAFRVLGQWPTGIQAIDTTTDWLVVNNNGNGQVPTDAYNCAGQCNRVRITAINAATQTITMAANPFAAQTPSMPSPTYHFQVVSTPVTYVCDPAAGTLTRFWNYTITAAQPNDIAAAPLSTAGVPSALLASGVTACTFSHNNAATSLAVTSRGLVAIGLTLQSSANQAAVSSGTATLFYQIHVDNTP